MKRAIFSLVFAALCIIVTSPAAWAKKPSKAELERDAFKALVEMHNQLENGPGFTGIAEWNVGRVKYPVEAALASDPNTKTKEILETSLRSVVHAIWRKYAQTHVEWLESFIDQRYEDDISTWVIRDAVAYVSDAEKNGAHVHDIADRLYKIYKPACYTYAERLVINLEKGNLHGWGQDAFLRLTDEAIGKAIAADNNVDNLRKRFQIAVLKLPPKIE